MRNSKPILLGEDDNRLLMEMGIQEAHRSTLDARRWRSLLLAAALSIGGIFLALSISSIADLLPKFQVKDEVLYAVFETFGCMLALGIAGFLLMRQDERDNGYMLWLACSVLVMGILDAFHASMTPSSNEFICLRSIAQLIGGLCIALIWLPERLTHIRLAKALPKVLAMAAGLFGIISLLFPEILPAVLTNGRFTLTAKMLNFTGGIFFLAGVAYCLIRFDCKQDTISALFAIYCVLFAVAGLTFMFTKLWSPGWWLLHLARLGAYVVAFKYVSANSSAEYMFLVRSKETLGRAKVKAEESKKELERVNKQLETSVRKANLLAQESIVASQAKSEFLANMSHELRTPLHSILSFASFGSKQYTKAKPEKLLDYFNRIKKSGQTLLELLDDLLDLAKLESKKAIFTFEPSDLGLLVKSVTNELDTLLSKRNLSIQHEVSKFDGEVTLDVDKIKQVLRNLLSNAIKFSPEGGNIDVAVCRVASSVRVSVCDQGPGIPQDELEAVFDKFVQSSKTKTGAGGTGLGLAICHEIVTAHKGRIWAENGPEGGAVFSFEIPLSMDTHRKDHLLLAGADNGLAVEQ